MLDKVELKHLINSNTTFGPIVFMSYIDRDSIFRNNTKKLLAENDIEIVDYLKKKFLSLIIHDEGSDKKNISISLNIFLAKLMS